MPRPCCRGPSRRDLNSRAFVAFPGLRPRRCFGQDPPPDCRRAEGSPGPGQRRRGAARRRGHRPVHRPLSQGSHRRPRRHPAARAGSPLELPARARGPPRGGAQEHRGAGQAHAGTGRRHRGRADQAGARGPLPPLQAEAPHQGPDRPRGRPGAAGRQALRRSVAGSDDRGGGLPQSRCRLRRCLRGAGRRARPAVRALGRGRRADRQAARMAVGGGPVQVEADGRQGREQPRHFQVPRLLRLRRADPHRALAPRAGRLPRPHAGVPRRQAGARRRAGARSALAGRRPHRAPPRLEPRQARRR